MSLIPDEIIEQVRDAADLIGIIGEHVELKRTGADYRGPCPFHGGTHRNFAVIPKKGMYYCFVCHEAGDVFTFFMKKLGMDYPTAVREVARRVGVTIPERGPAGPDPREPLFQAVAAAHDWFQRQLREAQEAKIARDYLASRHIDADTSGVLGLGFSPRGRAFLDGMQQLGIKPEHLLEAGLLVKRDDGTLVPRFRERVLFPILDLRSRVVGFGGRILGEGEPKYLNSPETPIFHKGQMLYNLHAARHAIRKTERAVLVEGYFDVIRLSLAGIEEVVAPLGTGLTSDQADLLKRHTAHVILLYDSDEAGLRATFRAGDELLHHGLRVSVATLPEGEDPDTLVQREGGAALERVLRDSVDVFDRKLQILEARGMLGTLPGRRRALDRLLPTIRAAKDPITKELYLARAAEAAHVRKDVLEREVAIEGSGKREGGSGGPPTLPASRFPLPVPPSNAERALLLVLLAGDSWRARVLEAVSADAFEYPAYREIFEAVRQDSPALLDGDAARVYEDLARRRVDPAEAGTMFDEAMKKITSRPLDRQLEELDREMSVAGPEEQRILMARKQQVTAERNAVNPTYKAARRRGAPGS
ncbi:MAG TPA: DNA primase [Gemmatimonadales bacterium]|nr:DNA primase [Gemmatimonadales bacterium]